MDLITLMHPLRTSPNAMERGECCQCFLNGPGNTAMKETSFVMSSVSLKEVRGNNPLDVITAILH